MFAAFMPLIFSLDSDYVAMIQSYHGKIKSQRLLRMGQARRTCNRSNQGQFLGRGSQAR